MFEGRFHRVLPYHQSDIAWLLLHYYVRRKFPQSAPVPSVWHCLTSLTLLCSKDVSTECSRTISLTLPGFSYTVMFEGSFHRVLPNYQSNDVRTSLTLFCLWGISTHCFRTISLTISDLLYATHLRRAFPQSASALPTWQCSGLWHYCCFSLSEPSLRSTNLYWMVFGKVLILLGVLY